MFEKIRKKIRDWRDEQSEPQLYFKFWCFSLSVWKQCGQILPQISFWTDNFYISIGYVFDSGIGFKCFYKNLFNINFCWHGKIDWVPDHGKIWITFRNKNLIQW